MNNPTLFVALSCYLAIAAVCCVVFITLAFNSHYGGWRWWMTTLIQVALLPWLWPVSIALFVGDAIWQNIHKPVAFVAMAESLDDVPLIPPPAPAKKPAPKKKAPGPGHLKIAAIAGGVSIATIGGKSYLIPAQSPIAPVKDQFFDSKLVKDSDFVDWEGALHFAKSHPINELTTEDKAQASLLQLVQPPQAPEPTAQDDLAIEARKLSPDMRFRMATAFAGMAEAIDRTYVRTPEAASADLQNRLSVALGSSCQKCQEFVTVWTNLLRGQPGGMPTVRTFARLTAALLQGR